MSFSGFFYSSVKNIKWNEGRKKKRRNSNWNVLTFVTLCYEKSSKNTHLGNLHVSYKVLQIFSLVYFIFFIKAFYDYKKELKFSWGCHVGGI